MDRPARSTWLAWRCAVLPINQTYVDPWHGLRTTGDDGEFASLIRMDLSSFTLRSYFGSLRRLATATCD